MGADPLPFVRRFALVTALVVIVGGTVLSLRRSPSAGALYLLAGALLLLAVAWPMLADRRGPRRRRSGTPIVLGLLGLAFCAFLGGTLLLPRAGSPDGSEDGRAVVEAPAAPAAAPSAPGTGASSGATGTSPATPGTGSGPGTSGTVASGVAPTATDGAPPRAGATGSGAAPGLTAPPTSVAEAVVTPPIPATARPVSVPTGVPLEQPTSTPAAPVPPPPAPTPSRDDLLAPIDAAWAAGDWVAVDVAARAALARYPGDSEIQDKLVAARVNRGDQLAASGQRAEAAQAYASARDVRPDPVVDARLAALTPTPTSAPRRTVAISGVCDPSGIYVGEWFVAQFGILNTGSAPIEGLRIRSSGPWESFSLTRADPPGTTRLEGSTAEPDLVTSVTIPPGNEYYVQLVAYAEDVGIFQFSFRPTLLNGEALVDQSGRVPTLACAVAVGEP